MEMAAGLGVEEHLIQLFFFLFSMMMSIMAFWWDVGCRHPGGRVRQWW